MSRAERIYRLLLRLYPAKESLGFEEAMLQHARDMNRDAQQEGQLSVVKLWINLVMDGIVNACREHWEGMMVANKGIKPASWLIVLLASLPGLLVALSRRNFELLPVLGYLYLGLLLIGLPVTWWRKRRFPVWALLPAGALVWFLTYAAGIGLAELVNSLHIIDLKWMGIWTGITIISIMLAAVLFVVLLRGQRVPGSVWLILGIIIFGNSLLAIFYSLVQYGTVHLSPGMFQYFAVSGIGPVEGLMLVAVGLLAARQHGVLALLVVIGGYSYMLQDSDYMSGSRLLEWSGLSAYLVAGAILFLVIVPIALLRAKTRLGRALAVFVPVVAFHVIRLTVPLLVLRQSIQMRPGDVIASINIVLGLILAWVMYCYIGETARAPQPGSNLEPSPLPN